MIKRKLFWGNFLTLCLLQTNLSFSQDSIPVINTDTVQKIENADSVKKVIIENSATVKDTSPKIIKAEPITKYDKIVKYSGDSIIGKVTDKNIYEIEYIPKGSNKKVKISTANVKEIFYSNGRVESLDTTPEKKKKDWVVTSKPDSSIAEFQITKNIVFDKVVKQNDDTIFCTVTDKNLYEISYIKPNSKYENKISTKSIKEIFYSDGRYELVDNNPEKKKKDWVVAASEVEWKNVAVTSKPEDIAGMIEKGQVDALFEAKKMNTDNETLERSAYAILKKKAFSMKATIILVTVKNITRAYGEIPFIEVKGIAYGKE